MYQQLYQLSVVFVLSVEMHTAANMFAAVRAVLVLVRSNKYIS